MNEWHELHSGQPRPTAMNDPFCYEPHPMCVEAAEAVVAHVKTLTDWHDEVSQGKMFGVLICEDADGRLGFLAAYSGQIAGRADWPWFVPAVFDYLQPDGYFKQEEARITQLNHRLAELECADDYVSLKSQLAHLREQADQEINDYKAMMREAKARRDAIREQASSPDLIRESQYQKAELRRRKQRWRMTIAQAEADVLSIQSEMDRLKHERSQRSDALQRWLFDQFRMLNARGERRTLTEIFAPSLPPAGSGECCAPRLLQYAYGHGLRPLQIAEFWQGRSPRMEIRHEGHFYTACRGKCKPILEWMLGGEGGRLKVFKGGRLKVEGGGVGFAEDEGQRMKDEGLQPSNINLQTSTIKHQPSTFNLGAADPSTFNPQPSTLNLGAADPSTLNHQPSELALHLDRDIIVVDKPSGLLSVPGKGAAASVESLLSERYGEIYMVHRLDMDTSGLMVVARSRAAYHHLQRQFLERTVSKQYIALVDGVITHSGTIRLPLRPDLDDRPRQLVDYTYGKEATTDYEPICQRPDGRTLLRLTPHTGRTHQLRVHCAHADGLAAPIVGDRLYGHPSAQRLCLHAASLTFVHPTTGELMRFTSEPPF